MRAIKFVSSEKGAKAYDKKDNLLNSWQINNFSNSLAIRKNSSADRSLDEMFELEDGCFATIGLKSKYDWRAY